MTDLARPKAVLFDWDGTLVDSFAFLHAAHNFTREKFGFDPLSLDEWSGYFGQPREKLYADIYGAENIEEAKKHFEHYVLSNHLEGLKPCAGAGEVLKKLHATGIPCGVVTNKKRALVEKEIENFGWDHYFVSVVGAADAEADKPSPAPIHLALEKAEIQEPFENVWFIGDTENDLAAANAAGCITVLILPAEEAADLLENYKVHLHCKNCTEFYEFLLQYG